MKALTCPFCTTEFPVKEYSYGICPNCKKYEYAWIENWDYKDEQMIDEGFEWTKIEET